ncbi:hypothetical protein M9H77_32777 [Catharanthus roseus]|uniref:Uncharacterized protein n=1 Tax=Catharanthus roseus TaxID=4058 RepID=A0ACC0A5B5_CATRO|nr:hypothetical protein M9H77_32777 [Catharanthus roseus]
MATKLGFTITIPRAYFAPHRKPFISASSPFLQSSGRVQPFCFDGGKLPIQRRFLLLSPKATTDQPGQVKEDEVQDSNIMPYCSIDRKEKKSIGEMEQDFLQALQAFYYEGKAIMSNEEFDNLKEELMWEGSSVVMLSADEQRFLEASMAYVSGNPIMSDKDYDKLKLKLKMDGSDIVVEGPRCSLRSRKVYSDLSVDYLKMFLLNVPAAVVALALPSLLLHGHLHVSLSVHEEFYSYVNLLHRIGHVASSSLINSEQKLQLPEPFSFIFTWFAALPFILWLSFALTRVVVKDFLILKGPCPNCGTENTSFFGTILSVSSGGSSNTVKCSNNAIGGGYYGAAPATFQSMAWQDAHATFYGDETASETMGGACGYGNLFSNGYGVATAALSTVLFQNGYACGQCFQILCVQSPWCYKGYPLTTITATNLCPPNWSQDSNNGGWCNPPRTHFDMSKPAFMKIAQWKAGIVPVKYRRVPCIRTGGIRFSFQGNGYWLLVFVMNVGGAGDIASMAVKGSRTGWINMSHNWGASYQAFSSLGGQSLSFQITSYTTKQTIIAYNVAPSNWQVGMTYQANVNFH